MQAKFISAADAATLITDRMTVAVGGFLSFGLAEDILCELEERFLATGHPAGLSLISVAGLGGDGVRRGINHFAHEGMARRLYTSNLSLAPKLYPLIEENKIAAFMVPQGVISHMMRAIAGKKPGVITHVGLNTFVDPRLDGGCMNRSARESGEHVVELLTLSGQEQLFYPAFSLDAVLIKGSAADENGNLSIDREAIHLEQFEMAAAAHNSGGLVIAQVDKRVENGALHPQSVTVPGRMVDYIVVGRPENSRQHYAFPGDVPSWCGEERISQQALPPLPMGPAKVICRRAVQEICRGDFINLGIGIPTGVSDILNEEGLTDEVSLSIESGVVGGVPASGLATGASYNPEAILKQPDTFDFYDGGGIDFACLGTAETDAAGNVNVSRFAGRVPGPGGFINITQNARTVCFLSSFTAGKSEIAVENGALRILQDGPTNKWVRQVGHITFSGVQAQKNACQRILYITERAVFELLPQGLTLIETAPGVDLARDILGRMDFTPLISPHLRQMPPALFAEAPMALTLRK